LLSIECEEKIPKKKVTPPQNSGHKKSLPSAKLDQMIEEAVIDVNDDYEQRAGFYTMVKDNLAIPFQTNVLGVEVTVEGVEQTDDEQIVAVCVHGNSRQRISILELPLPTPPWYAGIRNYASGHPYS
jgi:hypothetical protein